MCVTNFTESEQWDTVIEGNDDLLEKYMSGKSLEALELEQEESIDVYKRQGTTKTDNTLLERQRGITIQTGITSFQWENTKVNIIDLSLIHIYTTNEEKDAKGNLIRQERFSGSCSRSFYVGEGITQEDIKAVSYTHLDWF